MVIEPIAGGVAVLENAMLTWIVSVVVNEELITSMVAVRAVGVMVAVPRPAKFVPRVGELLGVVKVIVTPVGTPANVSRI